MSDKKPFKNKRLVSVAPMMDGAEMLHFMRVLAVSCAIGVHF